MKNLSVLTGRSGDRAPDVTSVRRGLTMTMGISTCRKCTGFYVGKLFFLANRSRFRVIPRGNFEGLILQL